MDETAKMLVEEVKNDIAPSLGVTEPGAVAYAAACAARAAGGKVESVRVKLNSGIYKNSFTCFIPGTDGMGCELAAALGAVAGDPARKLTAVEGASDEDKAEAMRLVSEGKAAAELGRISPVIRIEAEVVTDAGQAKAVIEGRHDRMTYLSVNGRELPVNASSAEEKASVKVSDHSFRDIIRCAETAENLDFLDEAADMDVRLFELGDSAGLTRLTRARLPKGREYRTARELAQIVTCGAIEARVRGAAAPAMALTGSGSHGILAMLPIRAAAEHAHAPRAPEQRALLLSSLITMYIKELSGLLSSACGCVMAGGTGAALGLTYLYSKLGSPAVSSEVLENRLFMALNSMAASVTGMICHGGNTGCSLKAAVGVDMAFSAAEMALSDAGAESCHGILGFTPEATMHSMGNIAASMCTVEESIISVMRNK